MKRFFLFVALGIVLNFISCGTQSDSSKTLEEYYALGFPKIDSKWSEQDLEKAVKSIEDLRKKEEFGLPKLNSEKSSSYFIKVIEELPKVDVSDSLNPNFQFRRFGRFEKLLQRLAFSYGPEERFQVFYSKEGIELNKLALIEVTKVGKLYQTVLNKMSERMKISNKSNNDVFEGGLVKVYEASIETHLPYHKYHPDHKIELANVIATNITEVWHLFKESSKEKFTEQITRISKNNEIAEVRKIYMELLKELEYSNL